MSEIKQVYFTTSEAERMTGIKAGELGRLIKRMEFLRPELTFGKRPMWTEPEMARAAKVKREIDEGRRCLHCGAVRPDATSEFVVPGNGDSGGPVQP